MECQLDEALFLVYIQLSEDLSRIKQVLILHNLLSIPGKQRQVEDQGDPVPVDKEQNGQESVNGGFGNDVSVEAVAEVDRVDVVTVEILRSAFLYCDDRLGERHKTDESPVSCSSLQY